MNSRKNNHTDTIEVRTQASMKITALPGIPLVRPGDDLVSLILKSRAVSSTSIGGLAMDLWNLHGFPAVLMVMAAVFVAVSFWPRWHHPARRS